MTPQEWVHWRSAETYKKGESFQDIFFPKIIKKKSITLYTHNKFQIQIPQIFNSNKINKYTQKKMQWKNCSSSRNGTFTYIIRIFSFLILIKVQLNQTATDTRAKNVLKKMSLTNWRWFHLSYWNMFIVDAAS